MKKSVLFIAIASLYIASCKPISYFVIEKKSNNTLLVRQDGYTTRGLIKVDSSTYAKAILKTIVKVKKKELEKHKNKYIK